jgi:hypothetical protein
MKEEHTLPSTQEQWVFERMHTVSEKDWSRKMHRRTCKKRTGEGVCA